MIDDVISWVTEPVQFGRGWACLGIVALTHSFAVTLAWLFGVAFQ